MLKEQFTSLFLAYKGETFNKYSRFLNDAKYGVSSTDAGLSSDLQFLQMELLEVVEEANSGRAPWEKLILPCMITEQQIDKMFSTIKNQLINVIST